MNKIIPVIFILIISFFNSFAQHHREESLSAHILKGDSLVSAAGIKNFQQTLIKSGEKQDAAFVNFDFACFYFKTKTDSAFYFYQLGLKELPSLNSPEFRKKIFLSSEYMRRSLPNNTQELQNIRKKKSSNILLQALSSNKLAFFLKAPDSLINALAEAEKFYHQLGDPVNEGFCINNQAFMADEMMNDLKKALLLTNKSVGHWSQLKDSMNLANMLKYRCLLLGKTGDFQKALIDGKRAIFLFHYLKNESGEQVANYDLANTLYQMKMQDSAYAYAKHARDFWCEQNKNQDRCFINNTLLIRILISLNNTNAANSLIQENMAMDNEKFYFLNRRDFYSLIAEYYKTQGNKAEAEKINVKLQSIKQTN